MMLSSPSFLVRENAADQLEHRRNDWSYSKPVVALDVALNLVFIGVALCAVVLSSLGDDEDDDDVALIRVWVVGYAIGCVVHVACVLAECRERRRGRGRSDEVLDDDSDEEDGETQTSVLKHAESANTMFSCVWWVVGAYWVTAVSPDLMHDSPELYWVCVSFLAFDIIFVALCVAITCLIGIAVCCFLPCIIAILYAVADQEGATQEEIERLQKFKFRRIVDCGEADSSGGIITECDSSMPTEHTLSQEDAECCICLCAYEEGSELRQLPCGHHFHSNCIDKWLFINAICPLCKFNILKPRMGEEEV
ncbi:hypothetical protein MLD38_010607 [Melastoma candidum]|uniref:Uncharacterized protein n=1 Tax=Melastoma candidum TaxID=119954 RepID=A0ACB9R3G5_9MYRT|nr:hypothetical protein MLD38_010607 [Melastoma candidum]